MGLIDDPSALSALPLEGRLLLVARTALRRLERDRDLNRLVCRDLAQFPDLLTMGWRRRSLDRCDVHHWFFYGIPSALIPTGINEDRYVRTAVALTTGLAHNVDGDET